MTTQYQNGDRRTSEQAPGPIYAFVPAHGDSKAGDVQGKLAWTWSEGFGLAVLLVDFAPSSEGMRRQVGRVDRLNFSQTSLSDLKKQLEFAEWHYDVTCIDLTYAPKYVAAEILKLSQSVFLVSDSSKSSLDNAREVVQQIGNMGLEDRVALLLRRTPGGIRPDLAEDLTGVPVCGLVETTEQLGRLATWMASPQPELAAVYA